MKLQQCALLLALLSLLMQPVSLKKSKSSRKKSKSCCTKVDTLSDMFTDQAQQTEEQLESLTQNLETVSSKLNSLTATTTQLSTELQEVQSSISDIACTDPGETSQLIQNLREDITEQLTDIESKVDTLLDRRFTCGDSGGWRRVDYLDLTDETTTCPTGWELTGLTPRTCGAPVTTDTDCFPVSFPVTGATYDRVCGRIRGYQLNSTAAFNNSFSGMFTEIDEPYAFGVSLTYGTPRQHIWTFLAGAQEVQTGMPTVCPCASTDPAFAAFRPPFVGEDFFCESGNNVPVSSQFFADDVLWDGEDCGMLPSCCSTGNPPFFTKDLPSPTSAAIEARICGNSDATVVIELVELYVQ